MNAMTEILKIAHIHAHKITYAMDHLRYLFPITPEKLNHALEQDLLMIELFVNRFSKLQDFMGTKLIDAFLKSKGEFIESMTMIDKINKLERFGTLSSADQWFEMRKMRNYLAHEYPDHPELQARYLNKMYDLAPYLILFLKNIENEIYALPS